MSSLRRPNFRGLSHREIGDFSDTLPFLLEAPIPFLDQPTGPEDGQAPSRRQGSVSTEPVQKEKILRSLRRERLADGQARRAALLRVPGDHPPIFQEEPGQGHPDSAAFPATRTSSRTASGIISTTRPRPIRKAFITNEKSSISFSDGPWGGSCHGIFPVHFS